MRRSQIDRQASALDRFLHRRPKATQDGVFDLRALPSLPAPWSIANGKWLDANRRQVAALGANLTGHALLPDTQAEADEWATILFNEGYRVARIHHWDLALYEDLAARTIKLDLFVAALKKKKIPWMTDGTSERCAKSLLYEQNAAERAKWRGQVEHLLTHTPQAYGLLPWAVEPYFLGMCPVNEDVAVDGKASWNGVDDLDDGQYCDNMDWYRQQLAAMGCAKPTWPSNAGVPNFWAEVPAGEIEAWHRYTDHPYENPIRYLEILENDQPWNNYTARTSRPLMLEEMGKLWPARNRALCEKQIVDNAMAAGAQIIIPYSRATRDDLYTATGGELTLYTYYNDPCRRSTAAYIAYMFNGGLGNVRYTPGEAQNTGFASSLVGERLQVSNSGTAPIVESVSGTVAVPDGCAAFAVDANGRRAARLAVVDGVADVASQFTVIVPNYQA
jgi:hypothetical protein